MNRALLSASDRWDSTSSVRSNPNTYDLNLAANSASSKTWHLSGYSGILSLPLFADLSEDDINYVMGLQLLEFVTKQARFEIECVNKVAQDLAFGNYTYVISDEFKLDALKIYTDEGYHSYFTKKLANQIIAHFKLPEHEISSVVNIHFSKISQIGSQFDKKYSYLSDLAIVFVAENQIVADISSEMKSVVHEPIVSMFKDHLVDEVFHAKYFAELLPILWGQMTDYEQTVLGINICESMIVLGKPRTDIYYVSLAKLGFAEEVIRDAIDLKYNNDEWNRVRLKDRMKPTIDLLSSVGVFQHDLVKSTFQQKGLL
ncbi:diiron oxygenase [Synechococcus sp. MU1617]|uniref:diiron oxygenase n=1 Tax=Synechococcus sp. MU1617 TaxID=2508346 RepID=UPI001CF83851|nr:diiron oxygenase [Synechococcus sp. MU1617]MCB4389459.1 diiron oxygenase [Synechococcus sp. MU1617]